MYLYIYELVDVTKVDFILKKKKKRHILTSYHTLKNYSTIGILPLKILEAQINGTKGVQIYF